MTEVAERDEPEQATDLFGRWLTHRTQQAAAADAAAPSTHAPVGTTSEPHAGDCEPVIMPSVRRKLEQEAHPRRPTRSTAGGAPDWLTQLREPSIPPTASVAAEPEPGPVLPEPAEPVWAEGFTPLSIQAPADDDLPAWIRTLHDEDRHHEAGLPALPPPAAEEPVAPEPLVAGAAPTRAAAPLGRLRGSPGRHSAGAPSTGAPEALAEPAPSRPFAHVVAQASPASPPTHRDPLAVADQETTDDLRREPSDGGSSTPDAPTRSGRSDRSKRPRGKAGRRATTKAHRSTVVAHRFRPRRGARTLVQAVVLAGVATTAFLVLQAYRASGGSSIAMMAAAGFGTALVWALLATTPLTRLTVKDGQLEIVRARARSTYDLTSQESPPELLGTPGQRDWKALLARRGMAPFEVTSAIVDPVEFTRVLRSCRSGDPT
ncbi:MAG: hypothetical protein LH468_12615 [Nocardioides sp.]|nr:hypothetical protein [Nocardioides sp.]